MQSVRVQAEDFDAGLEQARLLAGRSDIGAVVSFLGRVRDHAGEQPITAMTLEHYPAMTEAALAGIVAEAKRRWPIEPVLVIHRIGRLLPGENIVLVIVGSPHRAAAFEAAGFLVDYLKTRAPFWKKEETAAGAQWVEAKAEDEEAAARWERGAGAETRPGD
jgi:molybdopterin synthase catalytic subunit